MANYAYKVLGQIAPASIATWYDLYTVPVNTSCVVSTFSVVNRGTTAGTFRIAVRPAGAALDPKHYLVYEANVDPGDFIALTLGITLAASDVVSVYSANLTSLSFGLFGSELS